MLFQTLAGKFKDSENKANTQPTSFPVSPQQSKEVIKSKGSSYVLHATSYTLHATSYVTFSSSASLGWSPNGRPETINQLVSSQFRGRIRAVSCSS